MVLVVMDTVVYIVLVTMDTKMFMFLVEEKKRKKKKRKGRKRNKLWKNVFSTNFIILPQIKYIYTKTRPTTT